MSKIMSDTEIKKIIGVSGTSQDALINILNDVATELLEDILQVENLASHTITDERVKPIDGFYFQLRELPVNLSETITIKNIFFTAITGFASFHFDQGGKRTIWGKDSSGDQKVINETEVFVSYTAGFKTQDIVTVADNTGLADKTITVTVAGTETTWTFKTSGATGNEINVGASETDTATNIVTALGGSSAAAIVTLPIGTKFELGTATATNFTIVSADVPSSIKMALALIVSGSIAEQSKAGGVISYSVGSKNVTFKDSGDKSLFNRIIKTYLSDFRKINVFT